MKYTDKEEILNLKNKLINYEEDKIPEIIFTKDELRYLIEVLK